MSDDAPRRPRTFAEAGSGSVETAPRRPAYFDSGVIETPIEEDVFEAEGLAAERHLAETGTLKPARRFPFFRIFAGALGVLVSMGIGLWIDRLVNDLFGREDWLGYVALAAVGVLVLSAIGFVARELYGLKSLTNIQTLKRAARDAARSRNRDEAASTVRALSAHLAHRPETARGRKALEDHARDIIDNPGMIALAESELLAPLDEEARRMIANAARRVSVVTAVSPRALVDIGYVLFEAARLIRMLAFLYGGRPGFFGLIRLLRETVAHLAVTGAIAVGDDAIQQVLGHGLASKVSARLGEGVANGLMTARIGIAAMDLCRPMDFGEIRRPKVTDFLNVLRDAPKSAR
jgi:putative membrane protein